jgi:hypothetical protein
MEELERRFKEIGCRQLNALFLANNAELREFYEKLGYGYSDVALMEKTIGYSRQLGSFEEVRPQS